MSETPDEEVDYGSFNITNPNIQSDYEWSTSENDSLRLSDKGILISKIIGSEKSSTYLYKKHKFMILLQRGSA
jgi:hypothetical protein